ncbi:MAG: hypothetical protein HOC20_09430 [Chloroflexi bacterium]|jgi:FemAB family protein|nr:hypothetical protein [Chloroflexota bacterium]
MKIVRANSLDFNTLWKCLFVQRDFQHPLYQPCNIKYYEAYVPESQFEDCSFVVEDNGSPLVGLRMTASSTPEGDRQLSGFWLPILYLENRDIEYARFGKCYKLVKAELRDIQNAHSITRIIYQDFLDDGKLSFLGKHLLDQGGQATPYFTQIVDLSLSHDSLHSQIRKSYKSLINQGSKNLTIFVIDNTTITPEDIENFRLLHLEASGRETRSRHSWQVQYEMVCHKEAFIVFGYLEGILVTAGLFPYSPRCCFYGVSASKRDLFEKPLSHAVIWTAMLHAKKQGLVFFELPEVLFPNEGEPFPTEKEIGISTFKRGFGGHTQVRLNIRWQLH